MAIESGKSWKKEVGASLKSKQESRTKYYTNRAILSKGVDTDLATTSMEETLVGDDFLFGALKKRLGSTKAAIRMLALISNGEHTVNDTPTGEPFNVDGVGKGSKVKIEGDYFIATLSDGTVHKVKVQGVALAPIPDDGSSVRPAPAAPEASADNLVGTTQRVKWRHVNFRSKPTTNGNTPLGVLTRGTDVVVLEKKRSWIKIAHPENPAETVWVSLLALEQVAASEEEETQKELTEIFSGLDGTISPIVGQAEIEFSSTDAAATGRYTIKFSDETKRNISITTENGAQITISKDSAAEVLSSLVAAHGIDDATIAQEAAEGKTQEAILHELLDGVEGELEDATDGGLIFKNRLTHKRALVKLSDDKKSVEIFREKADGTAQWADESQRLSVSRAEAKNILNKLDVQVDHMADSGVLDLLGAVE